MKRNTGQWLMVLMRARSELIHAVENIQESRFVGGSKIFLPSELATLTDAVEYARTTHQRLDDCILSVERRLSK